MSTTTVNPVAVKETEVSKMEEVKVTIVKDSETAAILTISTTQAIKLAFSLQDSYDNESQFQRDALAEASVLFLKAQCQRAIGTWDNLVTKFSKTQRYRNMGREKIEQSLKDNPKTKPYWLNCQKAVAIKAQVR